MKKLIRLVSRIYADESTLQSLRDNHREPKIFPDLIFVLTSHFRGFTRYNPLGLLAGMVFTTAIFKPWWYAAMHMHFLTPYYVAIGAGVLCLFSALLHGVGRIRLAGAGPSGRS